ncbi:MAG TPA: alkaline phosphatase D family protein [Methylomirabilota bacterium]|nr:alkaline phosphatase D family protein [Methylomirabilota bacterium]
MTDSSAVVWVRGSGPGQFVIEYSINPDLSDRREAQTTPADAARDFTGRVQLGSLSPATRYHYKVSHQGNVVNGQFVTAPAREDPRRLSFLWSGDLGGAGRCRAAQRGYPIFDPMARLAPDFFLLVGDTIYADSRCPSPPNVPGANFYAASLKGFRDKHRYNRSDPVLQRFFRETSVYAIWDDHEVKNDFAGPTEPLMPAGRQAFLDYWPITPPPDDATRLYRSFRWGRLAECFILDTRQYRSPHIEPDGPSKTMLGNAQKDWLVDRVVNSDSVWKIVVSSVTLSYPTGEGWAWGLKGPGYESELRSILEKFKQGGVKNLVWLSADIHHAQVIRYAPWPDFSMYEFTAGPLSASMGRPRVLWTTFKPVSIFEKGDFYNFGQVTVDKSGLTVRIYDDTGTPHFEETFPPW